MKALEKAAKDRGEARVEPQAAANPAGTKPELSLALELLAADTPSPRLQETTPQPSATLRTPAGAEPSREQARAAAVMQAGGRARSGIGTYVRDHPLVVFGMLAVLFAIGFGGYVYLQIFHPAFFVRQAPAPKQPPPFAQNPAPSAAAPGPVAPPPLPSAPLLQSSAPEVLPQPPALPAVPAPQPKPVTTPAPPKPEPGMPGNTIVVSRSEAAPTVDPLLTEAYTALLAGRLEAAQGLYSQLARTDPKSIDALLGLAAIASQEGKTEDAARHYLAILELDPRHALAQSGVIGLLGRADPLASETKLKQLIAREPSAFLFFTLGNLYADQALWAQAQQAYFQAYHLEPSNPDYAYNVAVGLEHLSQPKLALGFYRRAVQLASTRGHANFNPALVEERIDRLSAEMEY